MLVNIAKLLFTTPDPHPTKKKKETENFIKNKQTKKTKKKKTKKHANTKVFLGVLEKGRSIEKVPGKT